MGTFSTARMMRAVVTWCLLWAAGFTDAETYMIYKDRNQPLDERINDLLERMTLEEKIGQMTQIERKLGTSNTVREHLIGSVISGDGSSPSLYATAEEWVNMVNAFQEGANGTRLGIPMLYGISSVHGHTNAYNATVYPQPMGVGATRDSLLAKRIAAAMALELRATGIPYAFGPVISLCRDPRWGGCHECYGAEPSLVRTMTEIIPGLQGEENPFLSQHGAMNQINVAACAMNFVGDGATLHGTDEGNTIISFDELIKTHMQPFNESVKKGVTSVLVALSSWNGQKMHTIKPLITNYLKNDLKFEGMVVSSWDGLEKITTPPNSNFSHSVQAAVEAGIDMIMCTTNFTKFIDELTLQVKKNIIPISRINDAVKRILRVKLIMGLFENPFADLSLVNQLGSQEHRELARKAVGKSLVLLKNGNDSKPLLPLSKNVSKILVTGTHANNLGYQSGGRTAEWQGVDGNNRIHGTTILKAIQNTVSPGTEVVYMEIPNSTVLKLNNFSHAIVAVGEKPYTAGYGDSNNLTITELGLSIMQNVCESITCVVLLITGRPLIIGPYIEQIDALVVVWLPGTEGQGVADVLYGDIPFTGTLPISWMKSVDQLPMNVGDGHYDPLFPLGFGLTTEPGQKG